MNFASAFISLQRGHKIRRKHWKGYWILKNNEIMMHFYDGRVINIKDTDDILYIISDMDCNDWEIADNYKATRKRGKIMKLFISQPMKDKTNEEIKTEREKIIEAVTNKFGEVEVIDSFFENAPHDAKPLWFLGKSLELLSTADIAYFASDWNKYRGCKIEHTCALEYGIEVMHFDD